MEQLELEDKLQLKIDNLVVQASKGKRFANYLIDLIVFYIVFLGGMMMVGVIAVLINPDNAEHIANWAEETDSGGFELLDRMFTLLCYGVYMGIVEAIFKGQSIGKFITGTKAVNEDGSKISVKTAFLRGLSRAVPFNAFSALGDPSYPWHDKWTDTYVIDIKASLIVSEEQELIETNTY